MSLYITTARVTVVSSHFSAQRWYDYEDEHQRFRVRTDKCRAPSCPPHHTASSYLRTRLFLCYLLLCDVLVGPWLRRRYHDSSSANLRQRIRPLGSGSCGPRPSHHRRPTALLVRYTTSRDETVEDRQGDTEKGSRWLMDVRRSSCRSRVPNPRFWWWMCSRARRFLWGRWYESMFAALSRVFRYLVRVRSRSCTNKIVYFI
jgi:hypothetical protein